MLFERSLEGAITLLDRSAKTLRVTQEIKEARGAQQDTVSFVLSPNVTVISSTRGILKLTALRIGQKVLVHYVTESGDRRVANTIAVMEPTAQPTAGFPGVQVAK